MRDHRRISPRIGVEAMCWEMIGDREQSALTVDLSTEGLRIERPFFGGRIEAAVGLQLEVPGIDEVMWARGDVIFDRLVPAKNAATGGPFGLIRRTGYHIALAAARDIRLIRDFVYDHYRVQNDQFDLSMASCYRHG
ncbi:MAG TPA: hypothetical protein VLB44_23680 [Kofleriaceae bacterium]|nr:hypothetical protein [Kofleriaceae bacterium]